LASADWDQPMRIEGIKIGRGTYQENLFTPTLALVYLIVSSMLGGILAYSAFTILGTGSVFSMAVRGAVVGFLLNWLICRRIFRELYDSAPSTYRDYSRHLRALYLYYDCRLSLRLRRSFPFLTLGA